MLVVAIVGLDDNSHPTVEDIVIGIVAGIVGMVSVALFYRGLAIGRMDMVAADHRRGVGDRSRGLGPHVRRTTLGARTRRRRSAVGSVALISSEAGDSPHEPVARSRTPLYLALGAGLGFGTFFVLYSNAGPRSGMWPLLTSRWTSASLLALVFAFVPLARRDPPSRKALPLIAGAGLFDAAANGFFLAAARTGLLSIVGAVSSLYPASTVLLAGCAP